MHADLLRGRFIEALARRAAASQGAVRERLEARVAQLQAADGGARLDRAVPPPPTASPSPLADLLDHIARHSEAPTANAVPELKSLRWFRRTWARLHTDQRLTQSEAGLPDNAGPLHSQRLLHRALTAMREHSPGYLEHFVAHADALVWLDQLTGGDVAAKKDVLLAEGARRRGRGRG